MARYYILDDTNQAIECTAGQWAIAFGNDRKVEHTVISEDVAVSTVFLGLDHNFSGVGEPVIFETMIFGGPHDEFMNRYSTWDEAVEGHKAAVKLAKGE
jgi:hypothetical protein